MADSETLVTSATSAISAVPMFANLRWSGGERFEGDVDGSKVVLDGSSEDELSPMQAVLAGLGGCMGIDIAMILEKGRQPLDSLEIEVQGHRAEEPPRRFVRYELVVRVGGVDDQARIQRAVDLSRDKYCSVWHTLAHDAPLNIRIESA